MGAVSGQGPRPDFNNGPENKSNCGCILCPGVYSSPTRIMAPPTAIPVLAQMEVLLLRCPTDGLLVGAILAKGPRPDFNNCPWANLNGGRILTPRCLFESDSNNGLLPSHSNLSQMEDILFRSPTYGLLVGAILAKCPKPDFNNGPGDNLNSGCILAPAFI